jgi:hypothetical protein
VLTNGGDFAQAVTIGATFGWVGSRDGALYGFMGGIFE